MTLDLSKFEPEFSALQSVVDGIAQLDLVKMALLLDVNGQQLMVGGNSEGVDLTGLCSLVAGSAAATKGIAELVREPDFSFIFHEGRDASLLMCVVEQQAILSVLFCKQMALGLMKFEVRKRLPAFTGNLLALYKKMKQMPSPFNDIRDDEFEHLFL